MEKHIAQPQMHPSNAGKALRQSPCPTEPPVGFSKLPLTSLNKINWSFSLIYFQSRPRKNVKKLYSHSNIFFYYSVKARSWWGWIRSFPGKKFANFHGSPILVWFSSEARKVSREFPDRNSLMEAPHLLWRMIDMEHKHWDFSQDFSQFLFYSSQSCPDPSVNIPPKRFGFLSFSPFSLFNSFLGPLQGRELQTSLPMPDHPSHGEILVLLNPF